MTETTIKLAIPQEFFKEQIQRATSQLRIQIDEHVEFYLVNLLCDFIEPSKINQSLESGGDALSTPLALILKQAIETPVPKRTKILKAMGDTSLYVAGFFQEYFNGKSFDVNYYITLGASAYEHVRLLIKEQGKHDGSDEIYGKLSQNFLTLVDVVAEMSEKQLCPSTKPTDLLNVYDRWNRCGSDRLRAVLLEHGITPVQVPYRHPH